MSTPLEEDEAQSSPFKGKTGIVRVFHAFFNSMAGLKDAWRHESAFRQEIVVAAILIPVAVGLNVTLTVQLAPGASDAGQLFVSAKSVKLVPAESSIAIFLTVKVPLPVLERVTV